MHALSAMCVPEIWSCRTALDMSLAMGSAISEMWMRPRRSRVRESK